MCAYTLPLSPAPLLTRAGPVLFVLLVLAASGCCEFVPEGEGGPQPDSVLLLQPTPDPSATAMPTWDPNPQPTDAVPPGYEVETSIAKDPITGEITVRVDGGPGMSVLTAMHVQVQHPDGSVSGTSQYDPKVNDEVKLPGTKDGSDRVTVQKAYSNGQTYTTEDTLVAGRELRTGGQGGGGGGGGC